MKNNGLELMKKRLIADNPGLSGMYLSPLQYKILKEQIQTAIDPKKCPDEKIQYWMQGYVSGINKALDVLAFWKANE